MTISPELFMAILSMDSYNRGYNAGFENGGQSGIDGLGETGGIGNATILTRTDLGVSNSQYAAWQPAGFYAVAYEWQGQTVISYRGTDAPLTEVLGTDWPIWNGDYDEPSVYLASQFYQNVLAANPAANIVLTGHSLGGALAGIVGGLYSKQVVGSLISRQFAGAFKASGDVATSPLA